MARAIWEGTISFGLVQIPVGLHTAESRDDIDFDLLDRRDMSPVGYQRFNRETKKPVNWDDIVKGYEYAEGKYVVLEKEDFKRANVKATQTIDIVHFTDAAAIDVMYFEKPYYLVPSEKGQKSYALLREVLQKTGKVGIARIVIRTRENIAAVMVRGPALILEILRFDHELIKPEDVEGLPSDSAKALNLSPAEIKMAQRLVSDMEDEFKPQKFKDTYHDDLMAFINHKIKAGDTEDVIEEPIPEPEPSNVVDIMSLLKRSLEGGKAAPAKTASPTKNMGQKPKKKTATKTSTKTRAKPKDTQKKIKTSRKAS